MRHGSPLLALVFSLLSACATHAAEIYEFYTGARQLAMGGAYVAVVNDETSLLTNPAALGKLRDSYLTVFDPEIHLGANAGKMLNSGNFSKLTNIQQLLDTLNNNKGDHFHSKMQLFPSIVLPNFGVGLLGKTSVDAKVNEAGTIYRLDYTNDYALALGANLRLFSGIIKLGFAGRLINRVEVHKDLDATATNLEMKNEASEGMGAAADIGLILAAPIRYLPSIGVVWRDVGDTAYTISNGMFYSTGDRRPQPTEETVDVGLALFPILGKGVRMSLTADYHDILSYHLETDHMRRVHTGLEFNFLDFFFLRAGLNQRYWTGGVEFASERFQLQLTSYGEEIGTVTTPKEDRRYIAKIALRF